LHIHPDASAVVRALAPDEPVILNRPHAAHRAARFFAEKFPGRSLYAVKANPSPDLLRVLWASGITHYDVASIAEVRYIAERFPEAIMNFMAPVRIRGTTGEAFRLYGVRHFALDSQEELQSALEETGASQDPSLAASLTFYVRLQVPADGALLELSSKFGVSVSGAAALLRAIAAAGAQPALTFHVGSQCLFPSSYKTALARCGEVMQQAGIPIAAIDVGGGFPGYYQNVTVPPLEEYFSVIRDELKRLPLPTRCTILCEPGRALVADGMSVITQVSLRRGQTLYINDGIYGSLNEYALKNWPVRYPVRVFTTAPNGRIREKKSRPAAFKVYGPTCDSLDVLNYLIDLPDQVAAGDWIEFQKTGAYSCALRTAFNGFYPDSFVTIARDELARFTGH